MSLNATEQALLTTLETDVLGTFGQPVLTLLTALKSASGNLLMQEAAIMAFVAQAPQAGISLALELEQQLINLAIAKLQAFMTSKTKT